MELFGRNTKTTKTECSNYIDSEPENRAQTSSTCSSNAVATPTKCNDTNTGYTDGAPILSTNNTLIDPLTTAAFAEYHTKTTLKSTYDEQISCRIGDEIGKIIEQLYAEGYQTFLSGMTEGFDLIAAKQVISLKFKFADIKLIVIISHPEQASALDQPWIQYYRDCCDNADQIITLSPHYTPDCFHLCSDFMIDNSSAKIYKNNLQPSDNAYTVTKVRKAGHQIVNIYEFEKSDF